MRLAVGGLFGIALTLLTATPTPAPDASPSAPAEVRGAYERAANEVLCYCGCARQTVRECTCGVAFQLRDEFEARLKRGETAESIVAKFVAEHGEQSRSVPPKKGLNLIAWFGPGIAILLAGGAVVLVIVLWSSRGQKAAPGPEPAGDPETDELRRRLDRELKEFDA